MSIKIGGVDLSKSIINLEYQLNRTQKLLEWLLNNNQSLNKPDSEVLNQINDEALKMLQEKYPEAGIEKEE